MILFWNLILIKKGDDADKKKERVVTKTSQVLLLLYVFFKKNYKFLNFITTKKRKLKAAEEPTQRFLILK